jgi:hypothetical protein
MRWSLLTRQKSNMVKKMVDLIEELKAKDPQDVKFLRMDNAKETFQ